MFKTVPESDAMAVVASRQNPAASFASYPNFRSSRADVYIFPVFLAYGPEKLARF